MSEHYLHNSTGCLPSLSTNHIEKQYKCDNYDEEDEDRNADYNDEFDSSIFALLSDEPPLVPNLAYGKLSPTRIVKHDICRGFPMMLANVINSGDINMISSFLDRYGNNINPNIMRSSDCGSSFPGLTLIQRDIKGIHTPVVLFGKDAIVMFWNCMLTLLPDHALYIDDIKVKTNAEGRCRLEFAFRLDGTVLFPDLDPGCIGQNVNERLISSTSSSSSSSSLSQINLKSDRLQQSSSKVIRKKRKSHLPIPAVSGSNHIQDNFQHDQEQQQLFRDSNGKLPAFLPCKQVVTGLFHIWVNVEQRIERIAIYGLPNIEKPAHPTKR